jgi:hypothetical protein
MGTKEIRSAVLKPTFLFLPTNDLPALGAKARSEHTHHEAEQQWRDEGREKCQQDYLNELPAASLFGGLKKENARNPNRGKHQPRPQQRRVLVGGRRTLIIDAHSAHRTLAPLKR